MGADLKRKGETYFDDDDDDVSRSVILIGSVELDCNDKLLTSAGEKTWAGRDAVSAIVERTWSRSARLTNFWTNMFSTSSCHNNELVSIFDGSRRMQGLLP